MAQSIGLLCLLSGIWFLFGMPIVTAVSGWKYYRHRKPPTGFLAAVVMLVVFHVTAGLIWTRMTLDWKLSFLTTIEAAGDAAKYGYPIEHQAELMLVSLLIVSTMTALAAGAATAGVAHAWKRRRSPAA